MPELDLFTLCGLIMMFVIGPTVGNYATSVVYRLPKGETPFEKHPYCGDCGTMLTPRDLFPIWSYVLSKGKCRYCGVKIRPSYTVIEVACGVLFMANFIAFGVSESFILLTALGVFLITLAALEYHEGKLFSLMLVFCFFTAALHRVLAEGSLFPMVQSSFLCFFVALGIWKLLSLRMPSLRREHSPEQTGYQLPAFVVLAGLIGTALPLSLCVIAVAVSVAAYALQRLIWRWDFMSGAVSLGIWLTLLYTAYEQSKISL